MPALPDSVRDIINEHNRSTIDLFSNYVRTFNSHLAETDPDFENVTRVMPLSGHSYPPLELSEANVTAPNSIVDSIFKQAQTKASIARSPFVALSGNHDENWDSLEEVSSTVHNDQSFSTHLEPVMATRDLLFNETKLNAYALDIISHNNVRRLIASNHLDDSSAYAAIKGWCVVMRGLCEDMEKLWGLDVYVEKKERVNKREHRTVLVKDENNSVPEKNRPPVYKCFKYIRDQFLTVAANFVSLGLIKEDEW